MENHGVPIEIFLKILQLLPYQQLLIARRVNKTWHWIISSEFQFEKLVLSSTSHFNRRWWSTYELVSFDFLVKIDSFESCDLTQNNFLKLKHLYLYSDKSDFFVERNFGIGNLVNHLDQLETLEIAGLWEDMKEDCLTSGSLRTLNIYDSSFHHLIVDCPRLANLRIMFRYSNGFEHTVEFKHPESVKSLEIELYSEWVESFSELEKLYLEYIYDFPNRLLQGNGH